MTPRQLAAQNDAVADLLNQWISEEFEAAGVAWVGEDGDALLCVERHELGAEDGGEYRLSDCSTSTPLSDHSDRSEEGIRKIARDWLRAVATNG